MVFIIGRALPVWKSPADSVTQLHTSTVIFSEHSYAQQNLFSMADSVAHLWTHEVLCSKNRKEVHRGSKLGNCLNDRSLGSCSTPGLWNASLPPCKGMRSPAVMHRPPGHYGANQDGRSRLGVGKPGFKSKWALLPTGNSLVQVSSLLKGVFFASWDIVSKWNIDITCESAFQTLRCRRYKYNTLKEILTWGHVSNLREKEREREKHRCERETLSNLGMCPDWESNPQPFGVWVRASTNWATGQGYNTFKKGTGKEED